ncbi:aldehyde dehydrogenase [Pluteus cervinus]|uniref:Aldehyde dehydrogenase n=1 Tax=Pluteus cervinus TaxID=181527 RepID=A0ACD3BCC4_9AGAR|nr:aldehyde dehydrogenase [Pluteus cervinus]
MVPFSPLLIDGKLVESSTKETFEVRNPYSGDVVGRSASASSTDCKTAIESAQQAFKSWEHFGLAQKRDIFLKAADIVSTEEWKAKIVEAISTETAATEWWSVFNWVMGANTLKSQAGLVNELRGDSFPSMNMPGGTVVTQRRAKGVIFAVAPWNAPFTLSLRAVACAVICGNTVVLKSSEYSPRSQLLAAELLLEAGLPPGVLNFISIARDKVPGLTAEIIAHPAVRLVNFTGSDRVGRILAMEAGKHLKPCILELGGKAPTIVSSSSITHCHAKFLPLPVDRMTPTFLVKVLNDASIQDAAKAIVFGSMAHSGQICMSTERVIVQSGVAQELTNAVRSLTQSLRAGNTTDDPKAQLSALFTESSAENVVNMLKSAKDDGAEVILGDLDRKGAVVQPHLLTGVKPGMALWERESFGPVVAFTIVDSVDEAVELANQTDYSLSAAVWTSDLYQAQQISASIHSGYVNINGPTVHSEPILSLVGLGGSSGYGRFDIEHFTDKRVIVTHPLGRTYPLVS